MNPFARLTQLLRRPVTEAPATVGRLPELPAYPSAASEQLIRQGFRDDLAALIEATRETPDCGCRYWDSNADKAWWQPCGTHKPRGRHTYYSEFSSQTDD